MSSALGRREIRALGVMHSNGYKFKVFLVGVSVDVLTAEIGGLVDECLRRVEKNGLSDEFEYHRVGFLIVHVGRRGVTSIFFHFGVWADMPELFHASWFSYNESNEFEDLGTREPIMCIHDVDLVTREILKWKQSISELSSGDVIQWSKVYERFLAD